MQQATSIVEATIELRRLIGLDKTPETDQMIKEMNRQITEMVFAADSQTLIGTVELAKKMIAK